MSTRRWFKPLISIFAFSILLLYFFHILTKTPYLSFSDSAKYADLARNIIQGTGYGLNFTFWNDMKPSSTGNHFSTSILPVHPLLVALSFVLFGMSDTSVVFVSVLFYILSTFLVYVLGVRFFSKLTGLLSAVAFAGTPAILNYALSGGTESLFIFEILFALFLFSASSKKQNGLGLLILTLMYFTRPQAFIYIAGVLLFALLINNSTKVALKYFLLIMVSGIIADILILQNMPQWTHFYSILSAGSYVTNYVGANQASSDILRGLKELQSYTQTAKRVFYNLYNLYKLTPEIISPYLFALFVISFFQSHKNKTTSAFKFASLFMVGATVLVTAFSIPLFRYIHPVVPLIYIIAVETLVFIVSRISNFEFLISKIKMIQGGLGFSVSNLVFDKNKAVALVSGVLVFIFVIGQTLGVIFLDSRFERKTKNLDKPPIYVQMAKELKNTTKSSDLVVTNLDTWGSWYGERKTVWFPLNPNDLRRIEKNKFDVIYLTNYLANDENYRMGDNWNQAFENPSEVENDYIRDNYVFDSEVNFPENENYERIEGKAVIFRKK